jgi:hypothetical protein
VFLLAALQIWNNESLKHFLQRAYRIVTDAADDDDLDLTFIHACIAHVLVVSIFVSHSNISSLNTGCTKKHQQVYQ